MSRRSRWVVAYQQISSSNERFFLSAAKGEVVPRTIPHPHWWCAADKPDILPGDRDNFAIRPVYNSTRVPEDAQCEVCGIRIREVQAMRR